MGRFYSIPLPPALGTGTSVAGPMDLWEVLAAAGKPFWLHEIVVGQDSEEGDAASEMLNILIKRATTGYTSGALGLPGSARPHLTSDGAFGGTIELTNQTPALGAQITVLRAESWNVQAGYQYLPTPETRFLFAPTEACIVTLLGPADAMLVNGTMVVEEI